MNELQYCTPTTTKVKMFNTTDETWTIMIINFENLIFFEPVKNEDDFESVKTNTKANPILQPKYTISYLSLRYLKQVTAYLGSKIS